MTGYGSASVSQDDLEILIEITSINRRNLEITVSLPREWLSLEYLIADIARNGITRGKINIYIKATTFSNVKGLYFEESSLTTILNQLREYSQQNSIPFQPNSSLLFEIIKSINKPGELELKESIELMIKKTTELAILELNSMRTKEGKALSEDILNRLGILSANVSFIAQKSINSVSHYRELLLQKLAQANLQIDLNDERVLKEIALYADRCDISEELTRLNSHINQFIDHLNAEEAIGRKMDFLCQEMNRELNTIGSKTNLIEVSHKTIDSKNELERIREQVQNIE